MKERVIIEFNIDGKMTWEEVVSMGLELRERDDNLRWQWGKLADYTWREFGQDGLEKLAREVGKDKMTLRRYALVYTKIPQSLVELYPKLSWTHFRVAAGQDDPVDLANLLKDADDNDWSIEQMSVEARHRKQLKKAVKPTLVLCPDCNRWCIRGGERCQYNGQHKR